MGGVGFGNARDDIDGGGGDEGNTICPNTFGPVLPIISTAANTNAKAVVMANLVYFFNNGETQKSTYDACGIEFCIMYTL